METVKLKEFKLYDELEVLPGYRSVRSLLVYAPTKREADLLARIHHAAILHRLGLL